MQNWIWKASPYDFQIPSGFDPEIQSLHLTSVSVILLSLWEPQGRIWTLCRRHIWAPADGLHNNCQAKQRTAHTAQGCPCLYRREMPPGSFIQHPAHLALRESPTLSHRAHTLFFQERSKAHSLLANHSQRSRTSFWPSTSRRPILQGPEAPGTTPPGEGNQTHIFAVLQEHHSYTACCQSHFLPLWYSSTVLQQEQLSHAGSTTVLLVS